MHGEWRGGCSGVLSELTKTDSRSIVSSLKRNALCGRRTCEQTHSVFRKKMEHDSGRTIRRPTETLFLVVVARIRNARPHQFFPCDGIRCLHSAATVLGPMHPVQGDCLSNRPHRSIMEHNERVVCHLHGRRPLREGRIAGSNLLLRVNRSLPSTSMTKPYGTSGSLRTASFHCIPGFLVAITIRIRAAQRKRSTTKDSLVRT